MLNVAIGKPSQYTDGSPPALFSIFLCIYNYFKVKFEKYLILTTYLKSKMKTIKSIFHCCNIPTTLYLITTKSASLHFIF